MITVLKFGGTSVQDAKAIADLVEIVQSRPGQKLVVVSALAQVTDSLIKVSKFCEDAEVQQAQHLVMDLYERHKNVARKLSLTEPKLKLLEELFLGLGTMVSGLCTIGEVSTRSRDQLIAVGELASSYLVHGALIANKIPATWADAREYISTNSDFNFATVNFEVTQKQIRERLKTQLESQIVVTQGFIASDSRGITTTLGRGGSDYSAAVFGAGLEADKVEIWTDVDGIMSADPRLVPEAIVIRRIHFLEAAEMAYFGAKVLHPATIYPAISQKIPVWILNSRNPGGTGTEITFDDRFKAETICGVAYKKNVTLVNIYSTRMLGAHGFLKSVFDIFARFRLSVDLISTSEVNLSLTLDPNFDAQSLQNAREELKLFSEVEINGDRAMISVIGGGIRRTHGLAAKIFSELGDTNVQMISMGASELNISFVVNTSQTEGVVRKLHQALITRSH
ncbi:MAG: lysine-sensitive aspartokinase 3 [Pseudomonadota bacterium]|nr:lysine-sensitive aspartokinase 3 [Pseudomonadota bacterium]